MFLLHNVASLAISIVLLSFCEYAPHRWGAHKTTFIQMFPRVNLFKTVLKEHGQHHTFYRCFNREDDPVGKKVGIHFPIGYYVILLGFVCGPLFLVDWLTALYFSIVVIAHGLLWNEFHEAMHSNREPKHLRMFLFWFRYVEYRHYLHHQHPQTNFGGLLPTIWDFILGTLAPETAVDKHVWQLLQAGEYVDRQGRQIKVR